MDAEHIRELFREFGLVRVRPMFGGAGLYAGDIMFALVSDDLIYLKTNPVAVEAFERENCPPFEYRTKTGKRALTSYWRLPDRLYDNPEELAQWARTAIAAARQNATTKPARKRRNVRPPAGRRLRR